MTYEIHPAHFQPSVNPLAVVEPVVILVICLARPKAVSRAKPGLFGPGQAGPLVTAQQRLWPGSEYPKAKAGGSGRGFSHVIKFM